MDVAVWPPEPIYAEWPNVVTAQWPPSTVYVDLPDYPVVTPVTPGGYITDSEGNYITDTEGNRLTWSS